MGKTACIVLVEGPERKKNFEAVVADGSVILKWIYKTWDGEA
jgi:hypothetical protein